MFINMEKEIKEKKKLFEEIELPENFICQVEGENLIIKKDNNEIKRN